MQKIEANQDNCHSILLHAGRAKPLRYLFGEASPTEKRQRILSSPAYTTMLDEIRHEAEVLLSEPTPEISYSIFRLFSEKGSRSEYEKVYFRRRKRLTTFALMAWLEPDNKAYHEALCDIVWAVCDEYTWCLTAHIMGGPEMAEEFDEVLAPSLGSSSHTVDLFAAETAFALSEIAALHESNLPALLQRRIRSEVYRRVLRPFLQNGPFQWEMARHNWSSVCAGSIGAAAIYLLKDEKELAAVLERVLPALSCFLQGYEEDGACTEGYLYWQYGFGFFVYIADLLKQRTADALNLFADEKVHQIALFQQKTFLNGRKVVNFSDSLPEAGVYMGLSHYLKGIYPDVVVPEASLRAGYNEDHCSRWAPAVRNLLWYREEEHGGPWPETTYYLKDAQWVVSRRTADADADAVGDGVPYVFAAKGGHNAEPHNHNDLGHFILSAGDAALLADLGSGQYTREYFGPQRYQILCNGSQGHSVPIINGLGQREGREARAELLELSEEEEELTFAVELSSAYGLDSIERLERRFLWKKDAPRPYLQLVENYQFDAPPESIIERFISWYKPEWLSEGKLTISGGGHTLIIGFDESRLSWGSNRLIHVDHFGREVDCYAVDFTVRAPAVDETIEFKFTFQ